MPTLPQLGDSENNLLAKTVNNTGPNMPVHGDGRWNLLYKLCQNTYEAAVRNNIIDGEVQTYYDLPITQGNPPLQSVYLVLEAVGVPLINRHPAGLYARTQNAGNLSDWMYVGDLNVGTTGATGATGETGATGFQGSTGPIGATGSTGPKGDPGGATGLTGATGLQGSTGATGITGASGINTIYSDTNPSPPLSPVEGQRWVDTVTLIEYQWYDSTWVEVNAPNTGSTGATGASGLTGATGVGAIGATGVQGATGLTGATGSGATGATGISGGIGATGAQGATGPIGATGVIGSTGSTGIPGSTGTQGATGVIGSTGATGIPGATGDIGSTGATGADGDRYHTTSNTQLTITGSGTITLITTDLYLDYSMAQDVVVAYSPSQYMKGRVLSYDQSNGQLVVDVLLSTGSGTNLSPWEVNLDGAVGIQGATGATGSIGATGVIGSTGATGVQGATGPDGATGVIGSTGATGIPGATGGQGATGDIGPIGATGVQGATGLTGATGVGASGAIISGYVTNMEVVQSLPSTPSPTTFYIVIPSGATVASNVTLGSVPLFGGGGAFSPTSISGLQLWLDASDEATMLDSGGNPVSMNSQVARWKDKSNAGNDFVQSVVNNQPTRSTYNGLKTLLFDGSNDGMTCNTWNYFLSNMSIFIVFRTIGVQYNRFFTLNDSGIYQDYQLPGNIIPLAGNSAGGIGAYIVNSASYAAVTPYTANSWSILSSLITPSSVTTKINSTSSTQSILYTGKSVTKAQIGFINSSSETINGNIAEVLFYNSALTSPQIQSIESYLSSKWSVSL